MKESFPTDVATLQKLLLQTRQALHLSQRKPEKVPNGKGRFDHIAFRVSGYSEMKASLDEHGAEYIERVVPGEGRGQTQIFVESPDKVMIELVFQPDDVVAG